MTTTALFVFLFLAGPSPEAFATKIRKQLPNGTWVNADGTPYTEPKEVPSTAWTGLRQRALLDLYLKDPQAFEQRKPNYAPEDQHLQTAQDLKDLKNVLTHIAQCSTAAHLKPRAESEADLWQCLNKTLSEETKAFWKLRFQASGPDTSCPKPNSIADRPSGPFVPPEKRGDEPVTVQNSSEKKADRS